MKILMFGWEFPPHIAGGLGTACYGLTKALSKAGTKIKFIVPKTFGDEDESFMKLQGAGDVIIKKNKKFTNYKEFWENFSYFEIGSYLIPYMYPEDYEKLITKTSYHKTKESFEEEILSEKFNFSGNYGNNLYDEVARYAFIAGILASKKDFDIIHAHDWLTYPAGINAKKISNKPLVIHVHATEYDRSGENVNQKVYEIEKQGMEYADRIITVSYLTRNIVIERYGIDPNKVFTVHNSVEPIKFPYDFKLKSNFKEKIVTFLGCVTFQKGPDYFVEAAKKVLDRDDNVRFVMAGSGDMLNKMIRRVAKLGIANKFHFAGFLKGQEVYNMYSISDVYVMPSVSEPFGITPLEAMMLEVPVIISKQSGVSEILKHALKVDFWDVDDLADAIYGLLHYNALSKMFKRLGKEEVDNLKWDNSAHKVIDIYKQLLPQY